MPSRINCPACQTAFAYSPALLGRTVRCRQCQHTFAVASPPGEETVAPAAAPDAPPPLPKPLAPPPLPARAAPDRGPRSVSRRDDEADRRRPRRRDDDGDGPRAAGPEGSPGNGALIALGAVFLVGFLVIAAGLGYLLWPSSPSTASTAQGPAPATEPQTAVDPPKNLDQIMRDRPDRGDAPARPEIPGPPPVPVGPGPGRAMIPPGGDAPWPGFPGPPPGFPGPPPLPLEGMPGAPLMPGPPPGFPGRRSGMPDRPRRSAVGAPTFLPVSPLPVQVCPMSRVREERNLGAPIESAVVAGGGRLLLLHLPRLKLVAVFDVNAGKVTKHIDAKDDRAFVAGGMNLFIVYLPGKNVLERYSCATLEREAELKSVFPEEVLALEMGSASNGPLVAAHAGARAAPHRGATLTYFDPITGKEIGYEIDKETNPFGLGNFDLRNLFVRVSANGNVVTGWGAGGAVQSDVLDGGRIDHHWKLGGAESLLPSADGSVLFARDQQLQPDIAGPANPRTRPDTGWLIPAVQGDYSVSVRGVGGRGAAFGVGPASADIFFGSESKPLLRIGELHDFEIPGAFETRGKTFDRSVILIPDAKVLAVVPTRKRDQLVLYRADLDKGLAEANFDYLFVSSRPPTTAVKGETYRYATVVKSKKGGAKVSLDAGPKGMAVTQAGAVTWDVPKDFAEPDVLVMLKVTDAGGQEAKHGFRVAVRAKDSKPK